MAQAKQTSTPALKRAPRILAGAVVPSPQDAARAQTLAMYESALQLMQQGKYEKARLAFNQMLSNSPGDLADRIRMRINACLLQVSKGKTAFASHEEHYDYAISLLNTGNYPDARAHFKEILEHHPTADYAFYGLAVLASLTGDSSTCLEHLADAIRYNPRNRIQARADSDFQDMADDPRFTELLYPEL